jgi:hypothetical protein
VRPLPERIFAAANDPMADEIAPITGKSSSKGGFSG